MGEHRRDLLMNAERLISQLLGTEESLSTSTAVTQDPKAAPHSSK